MNSAEICGGFKPVPVPAGGSVSGTLTGFVSPGPAWPATRTLTINTYVGLPDVARQGFSTTSTIRFVDDPNRASAYYRAVTDAGASPLVMGWVATHQGPNPDQPMGGVPVDAEYRRGHWRILMAANGSLGANADLMITTEHGTGRIIDIRELRDGIEASNDLDALRIDPSKETVIFHA